MLPPGPPRPGGVETVWGIYPMPKVGATDRKVCCMSDQALILLVEDREDDVFLLRRSFEKAGIINPMQVVRNGEEAISYLTGTGKYSDRAEFPLPELILLDLKMPRLDGFEILKWLRSQHELASVRVVVLSCSDDIQDVNRAYALGANSFLVKPQDLNRYVELSKFINDYWFVLSKSPKVSRNGASWAPPSRKKTVLLRQKESGCFYAAPSRWVSDKAEALNFERVELAEALVTAERLQEVDIVLVYEQPHRQLTVPVTSAVVRQP
jgi:CheY-like chemotaxis protein